jgi:carbamate kinase
MGEVMTRPVAALITHTVVDPRDPAFGDPTKFVGRFYSESEAVERAVEMGWQVREDPGRGWRRVLPSPTPLGILEAPAIRALLAAGIAVVAGGGGGVPVIEVGRRRVGVEAVVDKDHASALMAALLDAQRLVILTGVDEVMVDFGAPTQRALRDIGADALRDHATDNQFPAGSMGPKIEAALNFLAGGGEEVLITSPERLADALSGTRGTWIRK